MGRSPISLVSKKSETRSLVAALMRIDPGSASAWSLDAKFTVSPKDLTSTRWIIPDFADHDGPGMHADAKLRPYPEVALQLRF